MHYGIVGIGPVGAVFAAHLKAGGHDVSVVDLNIHRQQFLARNPLIISGEAAVTAQLSNLYTDMEEFAAVAPEVVLICTKSNHSKDVLRRLRSFNVSPDTLFISVQNGVDVEDDITEIFGESQSYRMVVHMGCNYVRKSEVWVSFSHKHFLTDRRTPRCKQLESDFKNAGMNLELTVNCKEEAFKKAILNMSLSSICALTRLTMRDVMVEPELVRMVKEITRESIKVGQALGYDIENNYLEYALGYLSGGGDHKPSMLVDIEQKRTTENEYHAGKIFSYAEQLEIQTPVIQTVYYLLKNLEKGVILGAYVSEGMKPTG